MPVALGEEGLDKFVAYLVDHKLAEGHMFRQQATSVYKRGAAVRPPYQSGRGETPARSDRIRWCKRG